MYCACRVVPMTPTDVLTLECQSCEGQVVRCSRCGHVAWWSSVARTRALNAAEAHRWDTGHPRVVVRDAQHVLREVLGKYAAA